jgi:hypothetical protein
MLIPKRYTSLFCAFLVITIASYREVLCQIFEPFTHTSSESMEGVRPVARPLTIQDSTTPKDEDKPPYAEWDLNSRFQCLINQQPRSYLAAAVTHSRLLERHIYLHYLNSHLRTDV